MLFYEAAEEDADPGKVIVTPPEEKEGECQVGTRQILDLGGDEEG